MPQNIVKNNILWHFKINIIKCSLNNFLIREVLNGEDFGS